MSINKKLLVSTKITTLDTSTTKILHTSSSGVSGTAGTGRVKSMRTKFENLSKNSSSITSLEPLDISSSSSKTITLLTRKPIKPNFQRASTSFELFSNRKQNIAKSGNTNNIHNKDYNHKIDKNVTVDKKTLIKRTNEVQRQTSDSTVYHHLHKQKFSSTSSNHHHLLHDIKENLIENGLNRHTSDPIKRSSIKRTPAFRVGEKQNRTILTKLSPILPSEFDVDINPLDSTNTSAEQFQQIGLTDTLKAALKQPLPTGPPPKKPPRSFDSPKDDLDPIKSFIQDITNNNNNNNNNDDIKNLISDNNKIILEEATNKSLIESNNLNNDINRIENKLELKNVSNTNSKSYDNKTKNLFTSCISSCTTPPIYDSLIVCNTDLSQLLLTDKEFMKSKNPSEHIYMEPFGHLKSVQKSKLQQNDISRLTDDKLNVDDHTQMSHQSKLRKVDITSDDNTKITQITKQQQSLLNVNCACPENHEKSTDLHYLCTSIDSNIKSIETDTSTENESQTSLGNTYEEIKILLNAAFEDRLKSDKITVSDNFDEINPNNMDDGISASSKTIKLSRSLTDKRKDYVLRLSYNNDKKIGDDENNNIDKNNNNNNNNNNNYNNNNKSMYGTLNRTFKTTNFKTFSFEKDDNDKTIDRPEQIKIGKDIQSTSDRINKYKQLIDNSSSSSNSSKDNILNKIETKNLLKPGIFDEQNVLEVKSISILQQSSPSSQSTSSILSEKQSQSFKSNEAFCDASKESGNDDPGDTIDDECDINLFQVCLLAGYNISINSAYIKWKYPPDEDVPQNIEQLVFPSENLLTDGKSNQDYSLILTDTSGYRIYGYCRRILPENFDICLPLAYCIITDMRAPGFYFKILKEIESRHGHSETQLNFLFRNLQQRPLPDAGKYLHLRLPLSPRPKTIFTSNHKIASKRLSLDINPKWLTEPINNNINTNDYESDNDYDIDKQKIENKLSSSGSSPQQPSFDLSLINRNLLSKYGNGTGTCSAGSSASLQQYDTKIDEILIRRPTDLRLESTELNDLFKGLGAELLIIAFSTMLLERKIILFSENISILSSCVLGLQTILYPLQWQYTLVTILPRNLVEICQAPFPVIAGMLEEIPIAIEDGIVIDLDKKELLQKCGDEKTILPIELRNSLMKSLKMVDLLDKGKMLSSSLIAEAFLRFYVELFVGYKSKIFEKNAFIQSHKSQSIRLFLEWFVETAMFRHFIDTKFYQISKPTKEELASYELFDARLLERSAINGSPGSGKSSQNIETIMKNSKIINKKGKTFKDKIKDFLNN